MVERLQSLLTQTALHSVLACRPMAQVVSRKLVTAEARSDFRPNHVKSGVDKLALEQGFLRVLRFPLSISRHTVRLYSVTDDQ
jgi:hypothetical protein